MRFLKFIFIIFVFIVGFVLGRYSVFQSQERMVSDESVQTGKQKIVDEQKRNITEAKIMWVRSDVVNVRQKPDLSAPVLDRRFKGDTVTVLDTAGTWSKIDLNGFATGWVFSPLLTPDNVPPAPALQVENAQYKIVDKNDIWWRYSYRVQILVNRPLSGARKVVIEFLDSDGFELDNAISYLSGINHRQQYVLRDETTIDLPLASRIASIKVAFE